MIEKGEIINKVDQSGLITINLEDYYDQGRRVFIDLKDHLAQGLILRERDFRTFVKTNDWSQYKDAHVAIDITSRPYCKRLLIKQRICILKSSNGCVGSLKHVVQNLKHVLKVFMM